MSKYSLNPLKDKRCFSSILCDGRKLSFDDVIFLLNKYDEMFKIWGVIMNEKNLKSKCDEATRFLESCFDENNTNDGLSFDERVKLRLNDIDDETVKKIVRRII